jgi:4-amino-4-deoxy-L-arabinose transferase-like glycosyltransferase
LKAAQERLFYPLAISALCTLALWLRWANFTWMHIDERVFVDAPVEAFIAYAYFADDHAMLTIARGLMTIMAVATVPAVAALGRRLYGTSGGLIAGFLLCILPLHVRYSHLATTDVPATLWMTLALLFAVRIIQQGRLRDFALAGICAGLAAASKYPTALIFLAIPVAAFLAKSTSRQRGLSLAISCTALSFALTSPYVLLYFKSFWQDFAGMANEHLLNRNEFALASAGPFAGLYALPTHFYYGAGLVFSIALLGAIAYRPRSWHREELVVLVAFSSSTFMRYAVPLAPIMAVLCARLFARQNLFIARVCSASIP